MKTRIVGFGCALALCSAVTLVPSAAAEPFMITGGTLTAAPGGPAVFTLTAPGFVASAGTPAGLSSLMFDCAPCSAANPMTLSFKGFTAGNPVFSGFPTEAAEYNGVAYPNSYLAGSIGFVGPNFSSSALAPGNLTISAPFTMCGSLTDFPTVAATQTQEPKNFNLLSIAGAGTATAQFSMSGPDSFSIQRVTYQFSPSPTPEPASLVLLAAGLLGAVVVRRRFAF